MRSAVIVLAGVSLVSACLPAAAQSTTRIEARSLHGATVTVEEGVRVFRPLTRDRVIDTERKEQVGSSRPDLRLQSDLPPPYRQ